MWFLPFTSSAGYAKEAGEVAGVVDVPVGGAHHQHRAHVVHAARHRQRVQTSAQGLKGLLSYET